MSSTRSRQARATIRQRTATNRAAARIRRNGSGTLATHGVAAGLTITEARSVAGSLRRAATKLAITGRTVRVHAGRHMRDARVFTARDVAALAAAYRPRKAAYQTARQHMLAA